MEILKQTLQTIGVEWDTKISQQFELYRKRVLEWNEKVNLTAIKDLDAFEVKHFADSVLCASHLGFQKAETIIDIGTGAGFPGLPLAISFPTKRFLLVDSLGKRIRILGEIIEELGIENAVAIHGRAEDLARDPARRERFDLCVSRAVADLSILSEYCLPFVRPGGFFAAYKSMTAAEEIEKSKKAIGILCGRLSSCEPALIPGQESDHQIVWIEKIGETAKKFPRKAGTPEKQPL